ISGDVIECEGVEERFPWRLAPIRTLAILATVASGGAMGTEAPAAYLGVAAGAGLRGGGRAGGAGGVSRRGGGRVARGSRPLVAPVAAARRRRGRRGGRRRADGDPAGR